MAKIFNPYKLFVGSFIPNWLAEAEGIPASAKLLYAKLMQFAGRRGVAWPKIETLAKALSLRKRQTELHLKLLEKLKLIRIVRPKGKLRLAHCSNRYYFLWHPLMENTNINIDDTELPSAMECASDGATECTSLEAQWNAPPKKENHKKEDQEERLSGISGEMPGRSISKKPFGVFNVLAKELHKAVYAKTHVKHTRHICQWAAELEKLHRLDDVDIRRIKNTLRWYCKVLPDADKFMPQGYCGRTFREKFAKIESRFQKAVPDFGEWSRENIKKLIAHYQNH